MSAATSFEQVEAQKPREFSEPSGFYFGTDKKRTFVPFTAEERKRFVLPVRWWRKEPRIDIRRLRRAVTMRVRRPYPGECGYGSWRVFVVDYYLGQRRIASPPYVVT